MNLLGQNNKQVVRQLVSSGVENSGFRTTIPTSELIFYLSLNTYEYLLDSY